jgi:hypothetical protein
MASFSCAPRKGIWKLFSGFKYLKKYIKLKLVMDHRLRDMEQFDYKDFDWERYYPGARTHSELMPLALGNRPSDILRRRGVCDGSDRDDQQLASLYLSTERRYSLVPKRQATVETSTCGSEFTALRIAIEKVEGLRYKLRMMGLPMDGPANGL